MPRKFEKNTISASSNKKEVDVDDLNFLLLGESDYNSQNPDNQFTGIGFPYSSPAKLSVIAFAMAYNFALSNTSANVNQAKLCGIAASKKEKFEHAASLVFLFAYHLN